MNPNFIDALAAGETWPDWFPLLFGGLFVVVCIVILALYLRWKGRDFRRDRDAAITRLLPGLIVLGPENGLRLVLKKWADLGLSGHQVWVRVIPEKQYDAALHEADATVHQGMKISGTITGPRHEYGARWVTRRLVGATDVYTVTVRDRADDPGGTQALTHELARHLWPHLTGQGWNRVPGPHDGHQNAASDDIARALGSEL